MRRSIVIALFVMGALGCQSQPESTSPVSERALWSIPPSDADFNQWQAPSNMLGLNFIGDVANTEHQRRILYYENDHKVALEIKLMPLPGGWDSMPANRAISGHFIYQQQSYAARANRHGTPIQWQDEEQIDISSLPNAAFSSNYQTEEDGDTWHHSLWVTLLPPAFVTFHLRYPEGESYSVEVIEEALQHFAKRNQTQWQASP